MKRHELSIEDIAWDAVRAHLRDLNAMLEGQSVNPTDSAVRITHLPTNTVVSIQDEKSQLQNRIKALAILRARLLDEERQRQATERGETRRGQIGSGDRSEKIRTYNFPQDRVTDHRIGLTLHNLDAILDGGLDRIVDALRARANEERLASATEKSPLPLGED